MTQALLTARPDPSPGAIFSPDRVYRYVLHRRIAWLGAASATCLFICLNPSTADEIKDDRTVTRCIRFALKWGFTHLDLVNIFALRSTDPQVLYTNMLSWDYHDPEGPRNDEWIISLASRADRTVVAWGNHGAHLGRGQEVLDMLLGVGPALMHFGLTKAGQPRHPLYLKKDRPLLFVRR